MPYLPEGWTEAGPGGMATNPHPLTGGIVDCAFVSKEWFVIFNRNDLRNLDGFKSREEAFRALEEQLNQSSGGPLTLPPSPV